jgi:thymidylate kinase
MKLEKAIILTGLDGSGKTRHALQLLSEDYVSYRKRKYVWMREAHFFSLPFMAACRLLGFSLVHRFDDGRVCIEHMYNKKPIAQVWSLVQLIDVLLITAAKIRLPISRGYLLVIDRYVHDILVDLMVDENKPNLYRRLTGQLLLKIVPHDAITIFFDLDPFDAIKRKSDIPHLQYLSLRRKYYWEVTQYTRVARIDSSLPYSVVHDQLLSEIRKQRNGIALGLIENQVQNRLQARARWKKWKKGPVTRFRLFFGRVTREISRRRAVFDLSAINPNADLNAALQSYVKLLQSRGLRVHTVVVVGSRAKNRWHSKSDVDTMVVASGLSQVFAKSLSLYSRSFVLSDRPLCMGVQAYGYTRAEFLEGLENLSLPCLDAVYWGKVFFDDGFWNEVTAMSRDIESQYGIRPSTIRRMLISI